MSQDEVRYGTTYEGIAKLKPAFPQYGDRSHAGNSSQVTDGAAAVVLMKRSKAEQLGLPVVAKYVSTALEGLEPRIMVRTFPRKHRYYANAAKGELVRPS